MSCVTITIHKQFISTTDHRSLESKRFAILQHQQNPSSKTNKVKLEILSNSACVSMSKRKYRITMIEVVSAPRDNSAAERWSFLSVCMVYYS